MATKFITNGDNLAYDKLRRSYLQILLQNQLILQWVEGPKALLASPPPPPAKGVPSLLLLVFFFPGDEEV